MVKNLRYLLMSVLVMLGMSAMAQTEFDFDTNGTSLLGLPGESSGSGATAVTDGDITEAKTATIGTYSVTVSAGVPDSTGKVKTPNRIWNTAPKLRLYSGKLNIVSSGANFKSIVFTLATQASKAKWNDNNTASVGTINTEAKTTITWSGDAKEVEFTIAGNTQISKITISTEGGEITPEPQPQPGDSIQTTGNGTLENPYTAADAIKVTSALAAGAKSDKDYYIKGKISSIRFTFSAQYGTATFNISEKGDTIDANQFLCYAVYYLENKPWAEGNTQVAVGDDVIICGKVINYKGTTPETSSKEAYVYSLNGVTKNEGGEEPQPQPVGNNVNVAQALTIIAGLENGAKTTEDYTVKGYVIKVTDISTQYGNATFTIADVAGDSTNVLTIFRSKGFNGENITDENLLKAGDLVEVFGKLQKYVSKDSIMTPELSSGKIVSINGNKGDEPGPQPQPVGEKVTVAEALTIIAGLDNGATTDDDYIVKGYVIKVTEISAKYGNATFTIADVAGDSTNVLTVFRAKDAVGEKITDENLLKAGDQVEVLGKLQKYVSKDSIMTPEVAQNGKILTVNGKSTSGINEVKSDKRFDGAIYNLKGQRISVPARGLYIMNGRKFFVK